MTTDDGVPASPRAADDVPDEDDHVRRNRESWDRDAANWVERGRVSWSEDPSWGIWKAPESDVGMLPHVAGLDVVELGCGTGYVSAWLARRGARPVGLDNSGGQLATVRVLQAEFDLRFPLVHADAERTPFADASFDLAISEYGAAIWCDPYRWIPEAARILRPRGELVFLGHSYVFMLTVPEVGPTTEQLQRPHWGMHRFEWPEDDDAVDFFIPHGDMIRLLRRSGFEVEDLIEVRAPEHGADVPTDELASFAWSRTWPIEEVWRARKRAG